MFDYIYLDYILLFVSSLFLFISLFFIVYLFVSSKKIKKDRDTTYYDENTTIKIENTKYGLKKDIPTNIETALEAFLNEDRGHVSFQELNKKYEILEEMANTAMSKVYLGRNILLEKEVVIKYINSDFAKLTNEIDILKSINHVNLPLILDIVETQNGVFLVENFIEGETLDSVISIMGKFH